MRDQISNLISNISANITTEGELSACTRCKTDLDGTERETERGGGERRGGGRRRKREMEKGRGGAGREKQKSTDSRNHMRKLYGARPNDIRELFLSAL